MSVFESIRVTRGIPEFFDGHFSRLVQACAEREFAVDEKALKTASKLFLKKQYNGFARIYVTAGDGAPTAVAREPRIYAFIEDRTPPDPEDAIEISIHDETHQPLFGGLKTGNYWFNAEALAHARRRRFDEALIFNDRAELMCACMANVFLVIGNEIHTPGRAAGARAGVIRDWVIKRGGVRERRLRREDVLAADEIFLTNSWIGVQCVATVEGRPLGPRSVGPRLASALERRRAELTPESIG